MDLVIFGAQGMALAAQEALKSLCPRRQIRCFLVTDMGMNALVLGGRPVKELASFAAEVSPIDRDNVEVLIATPENIQDEIEETLENYGFYHHRRLDSRHWAKLIELYHVRMRRFLPLSALPLGCVDVFVRIYIAKSHKDRPMRRDYQLPDYMLPVQVGAELCDKMIADFRDNDGDNISAKNGNYSELTALYWMWKNKLTGTESVEQLRNQYYGLAQYRRMLWLEREDILRLSSNDVDVVLPYPMPYEPDINAHHHRYLKDIDWYTLLEAIRELQPEYSDCFGEILSQRYLYNYNVILAKRWVLREYCEWLFPILGRVEELSSPKGCERCDRYIGYMSETLETLYFMKNADKLNIVHAECRMLV